MKTTLNIDGETWESFKRAVSLRYGGLRSLSAVVEDAIRCFDTDELLARFVAAAGMEVGAFPSLREVVERRPMLGTSSGGAVRELRGERVERVSRHK